MADRGIGREDDLSRVSRWTAILLAAALGSWMIPTDLSVAPLWAQVVARVPVVVGAVALAVSRPNRRVWRDLLGMGRR